MASFVEDAQTPESWVEQLRARGIRLSARRLREKARTYGQFYCLGRTVFLSADHVETILAAEAAGWNDEPQDERARAAASGGRG